ncbi:MAG: pyridoxine kinase, partial [Pseudomonadota bacterium]
MPICVVMSSYVAASRVGGGGAAFVLPPLGVDPILIPTTLMGRHPGWGAPGGGAVAAEMFAGVLEGVEASGVFALCDAVLTGYFASPDQVEAAASAIDRIKAADRNFQG